MVEHCFNFNKSENETLKAKSEGIIFDGVYIKIRSTFRISPILDILITKSDLKNVCNNGSYSWNGRLLTKAMLEYSHLKFTRTQGSVCEPIIFKKYFLNIMGHLNFHLASTKKKPRSLSEQVIFQVK